MKSIKICCLALIASVVPFFSSCSDDNGDGPNGPKVKMRLVKMASQGDDTLEMNLENIGYDEQGRVVSYELNGTTYRLVYSGSEINVTNGNTSKNYAISEGKICSVTEGSQVMNFAYNDEGYLETVPYYEPGFTATLTWAGGNVTKVAYSSDVTSYVYSEVLSYIGNIYNCMSSVSYLGDSIDPMLAMTGYFGKMPKNLLSSLQYDDWGIKFSYVMNDNGYPVTITLDFGDGDIDKYILTWEEVK